MFQLYLGIDESSKGDTVPYQNRTEIIPYACTNYCRIWQLQNPICSYNLCRTQKFQIHLYGSYHTSCLVGTFTCCSILYYSLNSSQSTEKVLSS